MIASSARRTRAWLDDNLFPPASDAPMRLDWRPYVVGSGVAVALVALQLARGWRSAPLETIWADDSVWLNDAMRRGALDAVTTPYGGYLQTLPRVVAEPLAELPVASLAWAMALLGAGIVATCALVVWRASAGHVKDPYLRAGLAAMVVLVPVAGVEMFANVTNSTWFLLFATFWLLLWRPATLARAIAGACPLFLAAVSTAGVFFLFPVALLRALAIRDCRDGVMVGAFAAGAAVQLVALLTYENENLFQSPRWDWDLLPAYAQRAIGGALMGNVVTGYLSEQLGTPLEVALAGGLLGFTVLALVRANAPARVLVVLAVVTSIAMFIVSGYARNAVPLLLSPDDPSANGASRYAVVPTLLLVSALFVWLDQASRTTTGSRLSPGRLVALLVLVAALLSFDVSDRGIRGSPTWPSALDRARLECTRTSAPTARLPVAGAFFGFAVVLPCDRLADQTRGRSEQVELPISSESSRKPSSESAKVHSTAAIAMSVERGETRLQLADLLRELELAKRRDFRSPGLVEAAGSTR
jgi:hypothetical protein